MRCTQAAQEAATRRHFALLSCPVQEVVLVVGWDGFLGLRSGVFVMHSDVEAEAAGGHTAQPRQPQGMARASKAGKGPKAGQAALGGGRAAVTAANLDEALHQAAAMGMAEYPEHLQVSEKE